LLRKATWLDVNLLLNFLWFLDPLLLPTVKANGARGVVLFIPAVAGELL
jgi:hypothetical protein